MLSKNLFLKKFFIALSFLISAVAAVSPFTAAATVTTNPTSLTFNAVPNELLQPREVAISVTGISSSAQWQIACPAGYDLSRTLGGPTLHGITITGPKTLKVFIKPTSVAVAGDEDGALEIVGVDIG